MPRDSLYVPFLIAGMIITVRFSSPPPPPPPPYTPLGLQQHSLEQMAGQLALPAPPCAASFPCQDMQCVENCDDPDPRNHVLYEQPVWQTLQMFRPSIPFHRPPFANAPSSRRNALSVFYLAVYVLASHPLASLLS